MLFSKYLVSTSAWSIHQRGKNVVSASSGNTTNFAPMACASRSSVVILATATVRESALWSGPSWAAAIFRCLAMNELSQFSRRTVDGHGGGDRAGHAAREVLAGSSLDSQLIIFNDDATTAEHRLRPARIDMALVGRVADCVVHHGIVDALLDLGIPDGDVGIGADGDGALARVQAVHARMVGRRQRDELIEAQALLQHAFGRQDRQPHLDPRDAVGHLLEGGLLAARDLGGLVELVRRVVGRINLEGAVIQPGPDRLLRRPITKRWAAA